MTDLPQNLQTRATQHAGQIHQIRSLTLAHGQADVWAVHGASRTVIVKRFINQRHFEQARSAYGTWRWDRCVLPELLGVVDSSRALVVEFIEGTHPVEGPAMERAFEAAGAFRRQLTEHVPAPEDSMPLTDAIGRRREGWRRRLTGASPLEAVADLIRPEVFEDASRTACHRDYTPTNWLLERDGRFRVIDVGHAGTDHWLSDVVKLVDPWFVNTPSLAEHFFRGFGRQLRDAERQQLASLLALHAIASAHWGQVHGDTEHRVLGERIGRRLLKGGYAFMLT